MSYTKVLVPVAPGYGEEARRALDVARSLLDPGGRITVISVVEELRQQAAAIGPAEGGGPVVAVGIGAAGFVGADMATVVFAPHLSWRNEPLRDALTHRIGKSLDWWFHAQGYPGSHVLVRSGGKDLELPDILYAAQLAAAHSKARGSGNVPVDYTRIKFVWRPRGAAAGQVHYSDQKTVFVDGELPRNGA